MKKTRKQKNFEWHHLMAGRVFSLPYMLRHNRRYTEKKGKRFKMDRFRATAQSIILQRDTRPFFMGDGATMRKGVFVTFPSKKVSIVSSYN